MSMPDAYEIYAIRYGSYTARLRRDNFINVPDAGTDSHESGMPIDYYVWLLRNSERSIVVDTGFDAKEGATRNRVIERTPREGLAMVDVDAAAIDTVIVTHLHYDHAGTLEDFPKATFHLQESELSYTTGRHMCMEPLRHAYSAEHICAMVRRLFEGRVRFYSGDGEVAPGVTVHHIGGHTMGLQCVRVLTQRGYVVLMSDASHFYENMFATAPFPIVYHVGDMLAGYDKMQGLAASRQHLIPGHDPLVRSYYPAPNQALAGIVSRLDVAPSQEI